MSIHYNDCCDIMLATCDIDYGHDCMQDGRPNSNKDIGTVRFSLVSFDKVRFCMQPTDVCDAGSSNQLKVRIAVVRRLCSASAGRQSGTC